MTEFREFEDGEVVPGTRYRVLRLIGVGGMGSVYEVEHTELGKRFVLKALLRELARRDDLAQRLRNEWRALARLEHANIVNVTDAGTSATGVPYYVMERLDGDTLAVLLRQKRRLHILDAVGIAASVLEALSAAHDIGIIHRDVKPANIFVVSGGGVKLLDFGIAKIADATSVVTARGLAVGTPRYMSPEQARGERVDGRSDLYATALILFEMITGVGPFDDARDANELLLAHLAREAPPLSSLVMGISPELERILASMLAKDCRLRPAHARVAAQQLRDFAARQRSAPATDATTAPVVYGTAMLAAAQRVTPSSIHESITRAEGAARRSQPPAESTRSDDALTQRFSRELLEAPITESANTGEPFSIATAPNTTHVSPPAFDGSTTLEMSALSPPSESSLARSGASATQRLSVPAFEAAAVERPERTEMLGEFTPAPATDAVPTRTSVPLPERARPISLTPPPVVDAGRSLAPNALPRYRAARTTLIAAAGVASLLVVATLTHLLGPRASSVSNASGRAEASSGVTAWASRRAPSATNGAVRATNLDARVAAQTDALPNQGPAPSQARPPTLNAPVAAVAPSAALPGSAALGPADAMRPAVSAAPAPKQALAQPLPPNAPSSAARLPMISDTKGLNAQQAAARHPSGPPEAGPFLRAIPQRKPSAARSDAPVMPASGL